MENSSAYSRHKCFDNPLRPHYLCARNEVLPFSQEGHWSIPDGFIRVQPLAIPTGAARWDVGTSS